MAEPVEKLPQALPQSKEADSFTESASFNNNEYEGFQH